jgi:signal transduction histidine kinase/ActR/RegA family two-component response regulator
MSFTRHLQGHHFCTGFGHLRYGLTMKHRQANNAHAGSRIFPVLVTQIYTRSSIGIVATVINASILVFVLLDHVPHRRLATWFSMLMVVSLIRIILNKNFIKAGDFDREKNIQRWGQLLIVGLGASGILWGSTAIFLFPINSVAHQVFIAFVLAGMVAGAVGVFSPIMPVFLSFSIPALVPVILRFLSIGGEMHIAMGAMVTLFGILTFTTAKSINSATVELIALKESFAGRLEERTEELESVNGRLRQEIEERRRAQDDLHRLNSVLEQRVADRTALAEARAKQLQALAVELIEAEERERQRISSLLHDDLQQNLVAIRFHLQAIQEHMPQLAELSDVEQMLTSAIVLSRHLAHELSPAIVQHSELPTVLEWLSMQMRKRFGLEVEIKTERVPELESPALKAFIFRAAQELLFNVVKHAGVQRAQVQLTGSDRHLSITVSDEGAGFDPSILESSTAASGLGLLSLRERASYIGGILFVESAPGQQSRITITIPIALAREALKPSGRRITDPPGLPSTTIHDEKSPGIRIMIVDDHKVMRQGLIRLVSGQPDIQVAGEARSGREAIEMALRIRPDAIVMDISMPEMDGIEATRRIKSELPEVRVIGLSMFEDAYIEKAMRQAGAEVLVSKTASMAELLKAIYGLTGDKP